MTKAKKIQGTYERLNYVLDYLRDECENLGLIRCIRTETSEDKRFTLDFYICNGRLIIIQHFPEHDSVEIFRPAFEGNNMQKTLDATVKYILGEKHD